MSFRPSSFSRREIQELFKSARTVCTDSNLDIKAAPAHNQPGRLLIITPKKIGNAPTRNLIKRRLKALFFEEKLYTRGYNCIFFCKPAISELSFQELKKIVLSCSIFS
jgi:ribonuclease P protein component